MTLTFAISQNLGHGGCAVWLRYQMKLSARWPVATGAGDARDVAQDNVALAARHLGDCSIIAEEFVLSGCCIDLWVALF